MTSRGVNWSLRRLGQRLITLRPYLNGGRNIRSLLAPLLEETHALAAAIGTPEVAAAR